MDEKRKELIVKYAELGVIKPAKQYLIQVTEPEELKDGAPVVYEFDYNTFRELHIIPDYTVDKKEEWKGLVSWDYLKWDWELIQFEALKKAMLEVAKDNGFDDVKLIHCKIRMHEAINGASWDVWYG